MRARLHATAWLATLTCASPALVSAQEEPCEHHAARAEAEGEAESAPEPCEAEGECDCCCGSECSMPGSAGSDPITVELAFGMQMFSRHLRYTDDVHGYLRPYKLRAAPAVSLEGRLFPGTPYTDGVGNAFGVGLRFDRSMGVDSQRDIYVRYETVHRIVEASALGRYRRRNVEVIGSFGYGNHAFKLRNAVPLTPDLNPIPDTPNLAYSYLRFGAEVRAQPWEHVGLLGSAAYLAMLSTGGMQEEAWFPHSNAGGVALAARAFVTLPHGLELRAGLEYRRYFHAMRSELGDSLIAGGALDQYTAAELTVAYRR